ncbi:MAG: response regulator [bacterium]
MTSAPSILIVACDPYLAGIYGRKFELDGWEVEVAESLSEGERKAVKIRPSIILLDADCAADISEEVRKLRSMPTILNSKIVILAEMGDRSEIERSLQAGASEYLLVGHFVPQEAVSKMKKLITKVDSSQ